MDFIPVASSNVAAVSHDGDILTVKFTNGGIYQYRGVTPLLYQSFMSSDSKGKFLAQHIKGSFAGEKVE